MLCQLPGGVISVSAEHTGSYEINANSNDVKLLYKQEKDLQREIYPY